MHGSDPPRLALTKWGALVITVAWWAMIAGSLIWNIAEHNSAREEQLLGAGDAFVEMVVTARQWNAQHGGVYVPITAETPPNEYLDVPRREIVVDDSLTLTLINPAYMTRQISEIAEEGAGYQFHLTSLKPIRPQNEPTDLEREALADFTEEGQVFAREISVGGAPAFFYMEPLIVSQACMACHGSQGYFVGDVRGGISVTMTDIPPPRVTPIIVGHLLLGVAGYAALLWLARALNKAFQRLYVESIEDRLTGLVNRRYFGARLNEEFARAKRSGHPLSLIMTDIDHFKRYNDLYGHPAGDACLTRLGEIFASTTRASEIAARYGGEEFAMIVPETTAAEAMVLAERLRSGVAEAAIEHGDSPTDRLVTLSIGIATIQKAHESADDLVNAADRALYAAKAAGRNRAIVSAAT